MTHAHLLDDGATPATSDELLSRLEAMGIEVINDHGRRVQVALDRGLRDYDLWNAHPLDNTRTTAIARTDMLRFLAVMDHPAIWVAL